MIRPMTQGMERLTPVETTRHATPIERRRHCGLARETSLTMDAVSGIVGAVGRGEGIEAETIGGLKLGAGGDGGEEEGVGWGRVGQSGLMDSGDEEELKRICREE